MILFISVWDRTGSCNVTFLHGRCCKIKLKNPEGFCGSKTALSLGFGFVLFFLTLLRSLLIFLLWTLAFSKRWASLVAQRVKRLPAMQESWVWSLSREDPLGKEMATHTSASGVLARKIPWTEKPGGYSPWGSKESDTTEWLHFHFSKRWDYLEKRRSVFENNSIYVDWKFWCSGHTFKGLSSSLLFRSDRNKASPVPCCSLKIRLLRPVCLPWSSVIPESPWVTSFRWQSSGVFHSSSELPHIFQDLECVDVYCDDKEEMELLIELFLLNKRNFWPP